MFTVLKASQTGKDTVDHSIATAEREVFDSDLNESTTNVCGFK